MIELENVVKNYNNHKVLKGINLKVQTGEIYGFIGHNGAGKSTTMNILAGLIGYQSGVCRINNRVIKKGNRNTSNEIGYLPEDPQFYPYMNAWEYLKLIGDMSGDSQSAIKEKSKKLLDMVKLMDAAKRPIGGYSRGMKQRMGIAVSMYHDPKVLLLDEPSSALDPEGRLDIIDIILELKKQGKTIFLSTHILNDIERICDRVGIINNGVIALEDELDSLMNRFIQPIYDIYFDKELDQNQLAEIRKIDYIENVAVDRNKVSVSIKDFKKNGPRLTAILAETGIPIISMNLRKNSLEEIFLKVVK